MRFRPLVGSALGWMMWLADARRRHITIDNLQQAYPNSDVHWIRNTARAAYANLGIVLSEIVWLRSASAADILSRIELPGVDVLAERMANRQPSILLSGHYGNWELLAIAGALAAGAPFSIVVHPQHNARADAFISAIRTRFGNVLIPMGSAARHIVTTLENGGTVAFLADQHADPRLHRSVPFFGRETPTYEAPAQLALRYQIPLFTAFANRMADGRYHAPITVVDTSDLSYTNADVLRCTQRHVAMLETAIRANPSMWSWQHRRWRTS